MPTGKGLLDPELLSVTPVQIRGVLSMGGFQFIIKKA